MSGLVALGSSSPALAQVAAPGPDSVTVAIEPTYNEVSGAHRWLFGDGYWQLWAAPVRLRVLHLTRERGGWRIEQRGIT